jgi:peptide methionine sulfoxide reductase MsrA
LGTAASAVLPGSATAAEPTVKVYFGAGCFWHVQHEFVGEEVAALKRGPSTITSVVGYAGGNRLGPNSKVCYHNARGFADYGQLGHAEAVQLEVPESAFPRFCQKYFSLFGTRGFRHDPQDRGGEYRSVLGLPGGTESAMYSIVEKAAAESPGGMQLARGRGDEPDTLGNKLVLVYDSNKFPFYAGELYHQFHNDFMGPAYGQAYNSLLSSQYKSGLLASTGCPDMDPARI